MLIKTFYDDTMSRVQALNGIHVSSRQTSTRGFERSCPPSLRENMCPKSDMRSLYIWWCLQHSRHIM